MNTKRSSILTAILAAALVQFTVASVQAQGPIVSTNGDTLVINNFDTAEQVTNNGGFRWRNWYGKAYSNVVWSVDDASNNPNSGCLKIISYFPDAGIGGGGGSQFYAMDGKNPFKSFGGLAGNGAPTNYVITNISFDVRILPFSVTNSRGQYPLLEFGTINSNYTTAFDFGSRQLTHSQTNWVHVSQAIPPSQKWMYIPGIFMKSYSSLTGVDIVEVDNIHLTYGNIPLQHPTLTLSKASPGLRIYAGSSVHNYDREELTSLDHNQSWIGGTYPVSYSITFTSYPQAMAVNSNFYYHMFLLPTAGANSGVSFANNEYCDYQAPNDLWLEIYANGAGQDVIADVAWKVGDANANPTNTVLTVTNSTAIGTWTLTFSDASHFTLTYPGGSASGVINDPNVATDFANPLVAIFGIQPNSGWGEGLYCDVAHISTAGVAGTPMNDDFTTDTSINTTNLWDLSNSVNKNSLILATTNSAWWVSWDGPAVLYGLGTKADLGNSSIAWKTPNYYANYATKGTAAVFSTAEGPIITSLIPYDGLPTMDGTTNGVRSANAFFQLLRPAPAQ